MNDNEEKPVLRRSGVRLIGPVSNGVKLTKGGAMALGKIWRDNSNKPLPKKLVDHVLGEFAPLK